MQALSMYILIRLDEGETDYTNSDSMLVKTVIVCPVAKPISLVMVLTI